MSDAAVTTLLDTAIAAAKGGRAPMDELFRALLAAELAIPSAGEVMADGSGFQPVLFDKAGVPMVACFTSRERMAGLVDLAPYALMMNGRAFLSRVPPGHGVVVNPGAAEGFDISPEGLARVLAEF